MQDISPDSELSQPSGLEDADAEERKKEKKSATAKTSPSFISEHAWRRLHGSVFRGGRRGGRERRCAMIHGVKKGSLRSPLTGVPSPKALAVAGMNTSIPSR